MKIALIGYGKMGHEIEKIALQRGHEIVCTIDIDTQDRFESATFRQADIAIEFTGPSTAYQNYLKCFAAGLPVVSGSTGWLKKLPDIRKACQQGQTFFYASNFSLGVNLLFALNKFLAEKMNAFPQYNVSMKEIHHTQKLDAPSGTALALADSLKEGLTDDYEYIYDRSDRRAKRDPHEIGISAVRGGTIVGEHEVFFCGEDEVVEIKHTAYSRAIFGKGAIAAAKFLAGKKSGMYDMSDVIG